MIKIISVGKIKHNYLKEGIKDYLTRLSKYTKIKEIELIDSTKEKEAKLILDNIDKTDYVIALAIKGKSFTSEDFSTYINNLYTNSISNITFIIGGSEGLDDSVYSRANEKISFSTMTFPHQMFKMMLVEQIYRAYKIMNNQTYHK